MCVCILYFLRACMHICVRVCVCVCMHAWVCVRACVHVCVCMHVCVCVCVHACICVDISCVGFQLPHPSGQLLAFLEVFYLCQLLRGPEDLFLCKNTYLLLDTIWWYCCFYLSSAKNTRLLSVFVLSGCACRQRSFLHKRHQVTFSV